MDVWSLGFCYYTTVKVDKPRYNRSGDIIFDS